MDIKKITGNTYLLTYSYLLIILYLFIFLFYIAKAVYENYSITLNFISLIIISTIIGYIYFYIQNKTQKGTDYLYKNSLIISTIIITLKTLLIGIYNQRSILYSRLAENPALLEIFRINLPVYLFLFLIVFNLFILKDLIIEKKYKKIKYYLIPFLISQVIYLIILFLYNNLPVI